MRSQLKLSIVPEVTEKSCTSKTCKQKNPQTIESFCKNKKSKDGLNGICKSCRKEYCKIYREDPKNKLTHLLMKREYLKNNRWRFRQRAWKNYGIKNADGFWFKWHDYEVLLAQQKGLCKICSTNYPGKKSWCVDHDHKNGIVRSILCGRCNIVLGQAEESEQIFKKMIEYINGKLQ